MGEFRVGSQDARRGAIADCAFYIGAIGADAFRVQLGRDVRRRVGPSERLGTCAFSPTDSTAAWRGGLRYGPTMLSSLGMNAGSRERLKLRTRWGWSSCAVRIRCTGPEGQPRRLGHPRPVPVRRLARRLKIGARVGCPGRYVVGSSRRSSDGIIPLDFRPHRIKVGRICAKTCAEYQKPELAWLVALVAVGLISPCAEGFAETLDPKAVRAAAQAAGLDTLAKVSIPEVENLAEFLKPGAAARRASVQLGKALFWDMQTGSDGQACGSCHFHAFADNRVKNQLKPGLRNVEPAKQNFFGPTGSGSRGGANYTLQEADFPFHALADPEENNHQRRQVLHDTDDVASSQGVFAGRFQGVNPKGPFDLGEAFHDDVFGVAGVNARRVKPRNTPTIVNAVLNHSNFWDGRAHNLFNGVSVFGPLDRDAQIFVNDGGALVRTEVRIPNSSLASQTVGPPVNKEEMSFFDRPFPAVGRKLLGLRPLGRQRVHPQDSVLGGLARGGGPGLRVSYAELVKQAFLPRYWNSQEQVRVDGVGGFYTQMEANFALFFGLAVQMYELTLISRQTPFDRFMAGNDTALEPEQLQGLLVFINQGKTADGSSRNPPQVDAAIRRSGLAIGAGNCVSCHGGAALTDAAIPSLVEEGELET